MKVVDKGEEVYCIFSAQYLPHMGGVENYTYNLAKKLIERNRSVIIVTLNTANVECYEKKDGLEIFRFPCYNFINGRYPIAKKDGKYHDLLVEFKNRHIDYMIVNTRFYLHSLFAVKYAYKRKIPAIVIEHGTSHLSVNNILFDKIGAIWEHILTSRVKRYCKEYYGVSLACCEWLKHFGINGKGALYNALDFSVVEELKKNVSREEFCNRNGIPSDAIIVAFTGRFIEEKGIKQLLSAIKSVQKRYEKVYLCLAGAGQLEEYIKSNITEGIILLGRLNNQQIIELLVASDIYCLPSVSEGFSTAVLEAAACKSYIITTRRGGSIELISSDGYGTIIDHNTQELIVDALKKSIEDVEGRKNAVEATYLKVKQNFTWDSTATEVINVFEGLK